jgi:peptidoglycan/LPS O-acetylase OafA/YrhL
MGSGAATERSAFLDLVRLALAGLVIFSHSLRLATGVEPGVFGASLGAWAVRGFFLLSGYLITKSWGSDPNLIRFGRRRFARIAPGFVVAFIVSVLIVAPLLGSTVYPPTLWRDALTLGEPNMIGGPGASGPGLNRPMWTIQWELICYALVPLLFPLLRRRVLFAAAGLAATLVALRFSGDGPGSLFGIPMILLAFLAGAAFAPINLEFPITPMNRLPDMSYGTYLYGWPLQLLVMKAGVSGPWALFAVTLPLACFAGYLSHRFVERPAMRLLRGGRPLILSAQSVTG